MPPGSRLYELAKKKSEERKENIFKAKE